MGGFMFINRIPHFALADKQAVSPFVSDANIVRGSDPLPEQGAEASWLRASSETDVPASGARQTVYNDQNYRPRGADNVVNFPVQADPAPRKETPKPVKLTIVRQSVSMKERVCWPYRQGSIEARNCRAAVGLKYRDCWAVTAQQPVPAIVETCTLLNQSVCSAVAQSFAFDLPSFLHRI